MSIPALLRPDESITVLGGAQARGVVPIGCSSGGTVLVAVNLPAGRTALISSAGGDWSTLGTDSDWSPHGISDNGDWIVGTVRNPDLSACGLGMPLGVCHISLTSLITIADLMQLVIAETS